MKRRSVLAITACLLFSPSSATVAQSLQKITITYASADANQSAPLVAQKKGYFAAEGLDVELQYANGGLSTPALISGTIQASGSGASALMAILKSAPLRIVGVSADSTTYSLWVSNDIKTAADLKGKAIGVDARGDAGEISARIALQQAGVAPDSVTYRPMGTPSAMGAGLEAGALSAAIIATTDSELMRDKGQLTKAHVLADLTKIKMPYAGLAMSEKTLDGDPVLAKKIVRAVIKGFRYMKTYRAQTLSILVGVQQTTDVAAVEKGYDLERRAFTRDFTVSDAEILPDLAVRAGLLGIAKDQIPPVNKIYDFTLAHQVNAELDATHWRPTP